MKDKKQFLKNLFRVLAGKLSWVGYIPGDTRPAGLPPLRKGVLNSGMLFKTAPEISQARQMNIMYAKDYRMWNDLELIVRRWKNLDNKVCE